MQQLSDGLKSLRGDGHVQDEKHGEQSSHTDQAVFQHKWEEIGGRHGVNTALQTTLISGTPSGRLIVT